MSSVIMVLARGDLVRDSENTLDCGKSFNFYYRWVAARKICQAPLAEINDPIAGL